jgi:hypothetical protein
VEVVRVTRMEWGKIGLAGVLLFLGVPVVLVRSVVLCLRRIEVLFVLVLNLQEI